MDKNRRDLVRQLFTLATEIFEDCHEPVSRGQAKGLEPKHYRIKAGLLAEAGSELVAIGATIIAALTPPGTRNPPQ